MSLLTIALNNLKIRKVKMLFIIAGMIAGTATIVTLFTITSTMEQELQGRFEQIGTRILITAEREELSFSYRGITTADNIGGESSLFKEEQLSTLEQITLWEQVDVVAPKLVSAVESGSTTLLALGVDFEQELKLKRYWDVSGSYPEVGGNQVLLGHSVAQRLGLATGDNLELEGNPYTISGVLAEIGTEEDRLIYFPLTDLQQASNNTGLISMLEVSLPGTGEPEFVQQLINSVDGNVAGLTAVQVQDAVEGRRALIERFSKFSIMVAVIVTAIGALIIGTTMMASVRERTAEIGVFRATGFRKSHIIKIIFFEAGIVSGIAGLGGYLLGMVIAIVAGPIIIEMQTGVSWNPAVGVLVIFLTLLVGILASAYPASRAAKLDPVEALRYI